MAPRILIADDEPQLHAAYRDCFAVRAAADDDLAALGAELFGGGSDPVSGERGDNSFADYRFDFVSQGEEAVERIQAAQEAGDPYAALFLDMRMPPGIDGLGTARRVRELDKSINIVVVTGYSDHNPQKIAKVAGPLDKLYYLSKPFRTADVRQLVQSLASKWRLEAELLAANQKLQTTNSQLAASEARIRHIALHDQLTRLPNRRYFNDHLEQIIRHGREFVSVLLIDLDHFKNVNDTLGHNAGDELIKVVGERIRSSLPEGAILSRLGGDEFAIAMTRVLEDEAVRIGQMIVAKCTGEFELIGTRAYAGASVGVTVAAPCTLGVDELLRRADLALYAAKNAGRATVRLFTPEMDESAQLRSTIAESLRRALADSLLMLVYQPIVWPDNGSPFGYEALLRWTDSKLGEVPPSVFVPVAEQCGLARPLGEWVISNALQECAKWSEGIVSINISPHHFQSRNLVEFIIGKAAELGIPHSRIQFEITETAMFTNPVHAAGVIAELRAQNIRIALDDFGTGYSSLVNLRDFEIDCIKIDKSFVDTLGEDRQASAIVTSVTAMARMLGLSVVAEGVETSGQVQSLRALGCSLMQGYYYSQGMEPGNLPYHGEVAENFPQRGQIGNVA